MLLLNRSRALSICGEPALVRDIMRICEQVAKQQEGGASWQQRRRYDGLIQIPQTVSQTWRLNGLAPL